MELDRHAVSPVVEKHVRIIRKQDHKVSVNNFMDKLGEPLLAPFIDAGVKYECKYTRKLQYLSCIMRHIFQK